MTEGQSLVHPNLPDKVALRKDLGEMETYTICAALNTFEEEWDINIINRNIHVCVPHCLTNKQLTDWDSAASRKLGPVLGETILAFIVCPAGRLPGNAGDLNPTVLNKNQGKTYYELVCPLVGCLTILTTVLFIFAFQAFGVISVPSWISKDNLKQMLMDLNQHPAVMQSTQRN